jgi:hypothetical protein
LGDRGVDLPRVRGRDDYGGSRYLFGYNGRCFIEIGFDEFYLVSSPEVPESLCETFTYYIDADVMLEE